MLQHHLSRIVAVEVLIFANVEGCFPLLRFPRVDSWSLYFEIFTEHLPGFGIDVVS